MNVLERELLCFLRENRNPNEIFSYIKQFIDQNHLAESNSDFLENFLFKAELEHPGLFTSLLSNACNSELTAFIKKIHVSDKSQDLESSSQKLKQKIADMPTKWQIVKNDILNIEAGAIVNAANSTLQGGGGVDGAIHRAAGGNFLALECQKALQILGITQCQTAQVVPTKNGGKIRAPFILHTVGPIFRSNEAHSKQQLYLTYQNIFESAETLQTFSLAIPAVSAGIYGCPIKLSAKIAKSSYESFIKSCPKFVKKVTFVVFSSNDEKRYKQIFYGL